MSSLFVLTPTVPSIQLHRLTRRNKILRFLRWKFLLGIALVFSDGEHHFLELTKSVLLSLISGFVILSTRDETNASWVLADFARFVHDSDNCCVITIKVINQQPYWQQRSFYNCIPNCLTINFNCMDNNFRWYIGSSSTNDFHLFRWLKHLLKGKNFELIEVMRKVWVIKLLEFEECIEGRRRILWLVASCCYLLYKNIVNYFQIEIFSNLCVSLAIQLCIGVWDIGHGQSLNWQRGNYSFEILYDINERYFTTNMH